MSQGFLTWQDFHPLLVGAGCLALGYVYGRHCKAASEIPADEPPALEAHACCAQSQSNRSYFEDLERCKCCVSAPAEFDTMAMGKGTERIFLTRSPYMDAAEGFEKAERSSKRDLKERNSMDRYGRHHMEEIDYTDGEGHGMRQHSGSPYFEKSYPMLEEERFLQEKTPYKGQKQKGTPVVKELFCSKGKAEMGQVGDEDDTAASVPWSQEILNKRIDYFNNVTSISEATDSGRSEESRKLRHFKNIFLKVSASSKGEATYNSMSNSQKSTFNSGGVERPICGLVPLATPDRVGCSHDKSSNSPHRVFGGGCNAAITGGTSDVPHAVQHFTSKGSELTPETPSIVNSLQTGHCLEGNSKDADRGADPFCILTGDGISKQDRDADEGTQPAGDQDEKKLGNELESTTGATSSMQAELLQLAPRTSQTPKHHVPDRCLGKRELKKEVPVDKVLKAEIYGLLNEADRSEVSFQEIISLLEERLQTNLQGSQAHIATLVHEVICISNLLEEEGLKGEVESEQKKVADIDKRIEQSELF